MENEVSVSVLTNVLTSVFFQETRRDKSNFKNVGRTFVLWTNDILAINSTGYVAKIHQSDEVSWAVKICEFEKKRK